MKTLIQRNLPLNVKYELVRVSYISIIDGGGCTCDNCGKLIANIAHIKSGDKNYNIGLDCMDTILENNTLLDNESYFKYQFSDKPAIQKAKSLRSKMVKKAKEDINFQAKFIQFEDGMFGFGFSTLRIAGFAPEGYRDPQGFDYSFMPEHKELTLNYIKGLTNVIF